MGVCRSCGVENRVGALFCDSCGEPLSARCAECGTDLRVGAQFCDSCGAAVGDQRPPSSATPDLKAVTPPDLARKVLRERSSVTGERRIVTVLFADAQGFTPLSARIGEEAVYEVTRGCLERMTAAVHRYEGTICQFTGDGVMAVFGAPIAHEDSARRAVSAALDMQTMLGPYGEAIEAEHPGMGCRFRVGLNTGPVVVGTVTDDLMMDYTAVGNTANLAARMETAAAPGAVYVSAATYREVADYFECEDLGPLDVKGKAEPVHVYRAIRSNEVRSRFEAASSRGLSPFVGRSRELAHLRGLLDQARAGQGQIVFVTGEAGIGKSRLLREFRQAVGDELTWVEGQCTSYGEGIPYLPVVDMVKGAFGIEEADDDDTIIDRVDAAARIWDEAAQKTLPYLKFLLQVDPGDAAVETMDPLERKAGLLDGLRALVVEGSARGGPVVAVVEDLHWADEPSGEAIRALADVVTSSRVLFIGTFRPGYEHPLTDLPQANQLALGRLTADDAAALTRNVLDAPSLPPALADLVIERSEGNPFFVEEVTKALVETGVLAPSDAGLDLQVPVEEVDVPHTIQDVILSRLDRLDTEAREALQLASVIGREFTVRLLRRISDVRGELEGVLAHLKALELIYEKSFFPELAFMFKHALTHDVAYATLLAERRKALHLVVAKAIEELYAERLAEHYETLAYHYEAAEELEKALDYLELSGDKAAESAAPGEAIEFLGRAVDLAHQLGHRDRVPQILERRVSQLAGVGRGADALTDAQRIIETGRMLGDRRMEGMGHVWKALLYGLGGHEWELWERHAENALSLADDDPSVRGAALGMLGARLMILGDIDEAEPLITESVDLVQRGDAPSFILQAVGNSPVGMRHWTGDYDGAIEFAEARRRDPGGPGMGTALVQWQEGMALGHRGDYMQGLDTLLQGLALAERTSAMFFVMRYLNSIGWVYGELLDPETAMDWNRRSLEMAQSFPMPDFEVEGNARLNLGDNLVALGRPHEAEEHYRGVETVYRDPSPPDRFMLWRYSQHLLHSYGELKLARGDTQGARAFADECLEAAERTRAPKNVAKARRLRGQVHTREGDYEAAEKELGTALEVARRVGNPTQIWRTHLALAEHHESAGRAEAARASYRDAWQVLDGVASSLSDAGLRETMLAASAATRTRAAAGG